MVGAGAVEQRGVSVVPECGGVGDLEMEGIQGRQRAVGAIGALGIAGGDGDIGENAGGVRGVRRVGPDAGEQDLVGGDPQDVGVAAAVEIAPVLFDHRQRHGRGVGVLVIYDRHGIGKGGERDQVGEAVRAAAGHDLRADVRDRHADRADQVGAVVNVGDRCGRKKREQIGHRHAVGAGAAHDVGLGWLGSWEQRHVCEADRPVGHTCHLPRKDRRALVGPVSLVPAVAPVRHNELKAGIGRQHERIGHHGITAVHRQSQRWDRDQRPQVIRDRIGALECGVRPGQPLVDKIPALRDHMAKAAGAVGAKEIVFGRVPEIAAGQDLVGSDKDQIGRRGGRIRLACEPARRMAKKIGRVCPAERVGTGRPVRHGE